MRTTSLFFALLLSPTLLFAHSAFDGTWKFNPDTTQITNENDKLSLVNGVYRCDSCVPKEEAKADGQDHPISGSPYFDTINVRQIDDHTIDVVYKKDGKTATTNKWTTSPDGKTLVLQWENTLANGQKANGKMTESRVGDAPGNAMLASSNSKSSNKITGEWKPDKMEASDNLKIYTYKLTNDTFTMSNGEGGSYQAKLDGTDAPFKGDPGITTVSVKKIDASTIEETQKRDGKVIGVLRLSVEPDGKHLKAHYDDKLQGGSFTTTAEKQ